MNDSGNQEIEYGSIEFCAFGPEVAQLDIPTAQDDLEVQTGTDDVGMIDCMDMEVRESEAP